MPRKKTKKTKLTPAEKKDRKRLRDRVRQAKKRARLRENRNEDEPLLLESNSRTLMPTQDVSLPEGGPPRPPSPSSAAPAARTSDGGEPARAQLSDEAKAYLTKWLHKHKAHPYPSRQKKDEMCNLLRISDPSQLDGWLCRARTKLRYQTSQSGSQVPKGFAKGYPTGARPTNSELAAVGGKPTDDDSEEAAAAMPAHDDANAPAKTPSGVALKKTPPATAEPPARSTLAVAGHEREETVFVTAPPGSLGVTVRTDGPSFGVITSINPAACKFAGRVSEGDRIATVDGRAAKCVADLKVGGGGERVVGVVRKKQRRGGGGPGEERPGKRHRQSPASTAAEAKSDGRTTSGQNPPGQPAASALPQADPLSLGRNPAPSVAEVTGAIEAATDLASRLAEERRAEVLPALSRLARLCAPNPDALYPKKPELEWGGEKPRAAPPGRSVAGSGRGLPIAPTDLDVLRGRGEVMNKHPGNVRFRKEVEKVKSLYRTSSHEVKNRLSWKILSKVRDYGGRFLEKDDKGDWLETNQNRARKKVAQALRETR